MKNTLFFLLIPVLLSACGGAQSGGDQPADVTVVSGQFTNGSGQAVTLDLLTGSANVPVDTGYIDENGNYEVSTIVEKTGFYRLGNSQQNFAVLVLGKQENITVNGDLTNIAQSYTVSGSKESERLYELNQLRKPIDSLQMVMQQAQQTQDANAFFQAQQSQQAIATRVREAIHQFIDSDPGSLASMAAVQALSIDQDLEYYRKVVEGIGQTHPDIAFLAPMKEQVESMAKLAVGEMAPEINLQNTSGEFQKLSSLRGNIVMVDFWASWCKPCRMENPNVVKMYNKYHDKGFDIYGVSLDRTKDKWTEAIAADNLTWNHVSDLGFWNSSVVPIYNVKSIPLTYLIDREGRILAKNLRGQALEQKLAEIFGE